MKKLVLLAGLAVASSFGAAIDSGTAAWTCSASNPTPCVSNIPANLGVGPLGPWTAAVGGSAWIGPTSTSSPTNSNETLWPLPGNYTYDLLLSSLVGGPFATLTNVRWASDNGAQLQLCAGATCNTVSAIPGPVGFNVPTIVADQSLAGITSIRVVVINDSLSSTAQNRNPSGFFIDGDVLAGGGGIPEPSTMAMFGLAGAALVALRRRKA